MLKRELSLNLKSFLAWTTCLLCLFLIVFMIYPSIIDGENSKMINEMMQLFPEEILKTFNMDIASIDSAFGWFKTEGHVFLLLIGGLYAAILGSTILTKEENDKTIEFLYAKPINRNMIVKSKISAGIIYIFLFTVIVTIFNYVFLSVNEIIDLKIFLLLSIAPIMIYYALFFMSMYIATFFHKTRKTMIIAIALVMGFYMIQMIGNISDKVSFIKYFSLFELASSRYILLNDKLNLIAIVIFVIIVGVLFVAILRRYNRKELVS